MDSAVLDGASSSPNDKNFSESADEVRARNDQFRAFFALWEYPWKVPLWGERYAGKRMRWNGLDEFRILWLKCQGLLRKYLIRCCGRSPRRFSARKCCRLRMGRRCIAAATCTASGGWRILCGNRCTGIRLFIIAIGISITRMSVR